MHLRNCPVPENILTPPREGIGISCGWGGSVRPQNVKKCLKLTSGITRGSGSEAGGVSEKIPFVGKVWIFSGTTCTQFEFKIFQGILISSMTYTTAQKVS